MSIYALNQTTAPAAEPVTAAEAKLHVKQDSAADDAIFTRLIEAARDKVESDTGRQLITADWTLGLQSFPKEILFPYPKLQAVITPTYIDTAGDSQSLAASVYQVDALSEPGRMREAHGQTWPGTRDDYNAGSIGYRCGYGLSGASVPEGLKQAMLLLIGHWYENREAVLVGTISKEIELSYNALVSPYKVGWLWYAVGNT